MCGMEQRNPQETSSVPEPLRRHSAEHRRCGTEGSGPPAKMTPGCGFVSYDLRSRCAYVCGYGCAFIRVRTGSSLSPGKGEQPPGSPSSDPCPSRTPRARLPDAATATRAAPPGGGWSGREEKEGKGAPSPVRTLPPSGLPIPDSAQSPAPPRLLYATFPLLFLSPILPSSHSPV